MGDTVGFVAAVGDAPRVLGVGGCWIDSTMMRSYEVGQESLAVKGNARGYAQQEYSSSFSSHSRRCQGSAAVDVLGLFSSYATTVIPRSSISWDCGNFQGLIHSFPQYSEN